MCIRDRNNTLVAGQKIPFFADPDQPFNQVMANVALRAETDKVVYQAHEWMTGMGALYVQEAVPEVATIFTRNNNISLIELRQFI